jgi:hypothetical protein
MLFIFEEKKKRLSKEIHAYKRLGYSKNVSLAYTIGLLMNKCQGKLYFEELKE